MGHMPSIAGPISLELTRGIISVKDYGAVGDGATDDGGSLENALAAAAGKCLIFPAGTYRCARVLSPAAGTTIIGLGVGEVLFVDDASADGVRFLVETDDVTFVGLK